MAEREQASHSFDKVGVKKNNINSNNANKNKNDNDFHNDNDNNSNNDNKTEDLVVRVNLEDK